MSGLRLFLSFVSAALIFGCAEFGQLGANVTPPALLEKTALPPPPATIKSQDFNLKLELVISKEGKVLYAHLRNSSGDPDWDSLAVQNVFEWKYAPAMSDGKPIQMKIAQTAHVILSPPMMMNLSEILCTTLAGADSVYSELQAGMSFDSLARKYSIAGSAVNGGKLGEIDIHRYGDEIQSALQRLRPGDFTHPLEMGPNYVIYKRQPGIKSPELGHN